MYFWIYSRCRGTFAFVITGRQLRAARVLLGWGQIALAKKARVAIGTIRRMESFEGLYSGEAFSYVTVRRNFRKSYVKP